MENNTERDGILHFEGYFIIYVFNLLLIIYILL